MEIREESFIYPDEVRMVCEAFSIDPVAAIAEGSLLITVRPNRSANVLKKLHLGSINASIVGQVTDDVETRTLKRRDGSVAQLAIPRQDPFWPAFFDSLSS
jgi:hydrogenase maturation factor